MSLLLQAALRYQEGSWAHRQSQEAIARMANRGGGDLVVQEQDPFGKHVIREKAARGTWRPPPGWVESQHPMARYQVPSVSLGRAKWNPSELGASIFHANRATSLIQDTELPKVWQSGARAAKAAELSTATVQVMGVPLQLFPRMTASRALVWGTVLAGWGVGAIAATALRTMGVRDLDDLKVRVPEALAPATERLQSIAEKARPSAKEAGTAVLGHTPDGAAAAVASGVRRHLRSSVSAA